MKISRRGVHQSKLNEEKKKDEKPANYNLRVTILAMVAVIPVVVLFLWKRRTRSRFLKCRTEMERSLEPLIALSALWLRETCRACSTESFISGRLKLSDV